MEMFVFITGWITGLFLGTVISLMVLTLSELNEEKITSEDQNQ